MIASRIDFATPHATATAGVVRLDDVHVTFLAGLARPVPALRGLTLHIDAGTVLGLLGPNGAGKTTTIACLLGLLAPQSGRVRLWDRDVAPMEPLDGRRVGVLLEDTRLPPFLTVIAALRLTGKLRGLVGASLESEVSRVVEICRAGDLRDRRIAALSKGQARRAGLASALIGEPELLVLDEPSAGLDPDARAEFDALVRGLRDGRRTILLASHLLGDVEATCTHVAVVREGRVVLAGRTDELLREARAGGGLDVHVDATRAPELDLLGIASSPSRYPGLVLLRTTLESEDLFAQLAGARIVPRRVEPSVSVLSIYLDTTRAAEET